MPQNSRQISLPKNKKSPAQEEALMWLALGNPHPCHITNTMTERIPREMIDVVIFNVCGSWYADWLMKLAGASL